MPRSMSLWHQLREIALADSSDLAWDRLDTQLIEYCNRYSGLIKQTISMVDAGIVRLGGRPGDSVEDGPVAETWMEHLLQVLRRLALDQTVTLNSETGQALAMHSVTPDGRLVAVNESWCRLSGYQSKDVIGRPWVDFLAEDSRKRAINHNLPHFFRVGVIRTEYDMILKNGYVAPIDVSAGSEIGANGAVTRSITIVRKK